MTHHTPEHVTPDDVPPTGDAPLPTGVWREAGTNLPGAAEAPGGLVLSARGLQFAGHEGAVFGPLDLDLPAGNVGVVTGQQGSGRSALLLALAGRLKGVTGTLQAGDIDGIRSPRALRKQVSVARISGLADLEPNLTVAESRDERAIADGLGQRRGRERFDLLEDLLGHRFDREERIERLPAIERTLLGVVLGALVPSRYIVLDDIEASLTEFQLAEVYAAIDRLAEDGATFVVSALEQDAVPPNATVWHLTTPEHDEPAPRPDVAPRHAAEGAASPEARPPHQEIRRDDTSHHPAPHETTTTGHDVAHEDA